MKKSIIISNANFQLVLIVTLAAAVRIIFFTGTVFSDDVYYNYLSYTLSNSDFAKDYIGYPITLLRVGWLFLTSIVFRIFGISEITSVILPFFFSMAGIILIYHFSIILGYSKQIGLTAAGILSFFPPDIIFSTINLPDLAASGLIYTGILFLLKFQDNKKILFLIIAFLLFLISVSFKFYLYYFSWVFTILFFYYSYKLKTIKYEYFLPAIASVLFLLIESLVAYFNSKGFYYRFQIMDENYSYAYYDFFPNNISLNPEKESYIKLLIEQFILNIKYLFLRRFYLFLPLIAFIFCLIRIVYNRDYKFIYFLFLGVSLLMVFASTSPFSYKPLHLNFSWYMFPIFPSAIIIFSELLNSFRKKIQLLLIILFFIGSGFMLRSYKEFFDYKNKKEFKNYIVNETRSIITDNFTAYGLLTIIPERFNSINRNSEGVLLPYNNTIIIHSYETEKELNKQGNKLSITLEDLSELKYKKLKSFGFYSIYEVKN